MEQDRLHAQNRFLHQQLEAHKQAIIKLEAEKARLQQELDRLKPSHQFYTCAKCGRRTDDLACCWYDAEKGVDAE